ncbi:MAG: hypothetical protein Q4D73_05335 [Actinomycetaceae bacterium]|nr:hypothetical protein [Actinomycetaceae bacterium]
MSAELNDSQGTLDQAKLADLTAELADFEVFCERVLIRDELRRQGFLLLAVAAVAGFLNILVLNGQGVTEWSQLPFYWFSVSGSSWLITILLRFLSFAAVFALVLGVVVSVLAPFWRKRLYAQAHADFVARGWVAQSVSLGLSVDDDNLWIRKPVQVLAFSPAAKFVAKHWQSDLRLLRKDVADSAKALMLRLLLQDRQFHGARSVKSLRGHYEPPEVGGFTLVGFGPLEKMPAQGAFVVVAPPDAEAVKNPEAFQKLIYWIKDL